MKAISKDTKTYKLFEALQAGEKVTAAQASKRFGIQQKQAASVHMVTLFMQIHVRLVTMLT
jgi:hypothetical protein